MDILKGDIVEVISGEGRGQKRGEGKQGRVLFVDRKQKRLIVEGVNLVRRHNKPSQSNPQGGILEKEAPIEISNVLLVSPRLGKGVRVRHKKLEDGTVMRICAETGDHIPPPAKK